MVVQKRLLVLANSVKKGGRCIAGREVLSDGKRKRLGSWIRPVSSHGEGELVLGETRYRDDQPLNVLEVADVRLSELVKDSCQPENWRIAGHPVWGKPDEDYTQPPLRRLEEFPVELWVEPGNRSDRVSHQHLAASPPEQSLYVIRPEGLRIQFFTDNWEGRSKRKRRCQFTYKGREYNFGLTDPAIEEKHAIQFPAYGQPALNLRLPCGDDLLICISLAGAFNGQHYKLVATIFEDVA